MSKVFLIRFKDNGKNTPVAYGYNVEEVREFLGKYEKETSGKDWFIGFTQFGNYSTHTLPVLQNFERYGLKANGKY